MVAARSGLTERAEGHYRDALALAEELEMRPLVARCRQGLGRLYAHVGKYDQARDHLGAAIAMYRDMGMYRNAGSGALLVAVLRGGGYGAALEDDHECNSLDAAGACRGVPRAGR